MLKQTITIEVTGVTEEGLKLARETVYAKIEEGYLAAFEKASFGSYTLHVYETEEGGAA